MRARYKWPGGTGIITLGDDATLGDVVKELTTRTLVTNFGIKFGPPTAMKDLDMTETDQLAKSLGIHGETLTLVPREERPFPSKQSIGEEHSFRAEHHGEQKLEPHEVNVPWGSREGTLLLRVMPSDNSCLFTAFGGALPQQVPASKLRQMMAEYIRQHPDVYTEAVLGVPPEQYCRSIMNPDRWGGGIELTVLSNIFDIRICTYDVETQNLIPFGEGKRDQCILVYSGIHYDRISFSYSDYPYTDPMLPPEMDRTTWPIEDVEVLAKAQELVGKLHMAHYFTNMDGLVLKCDVAGCGWIGSGQAAGQKHAEATGHGQLSEVVDTRAGAILRRCNARGCDFMGQGDNAARQHSRDTGHKSYLVIEDS
ncbi:Ovarian tumor, otubain [Cordyceps fumosorosea ARSEF 2679]|uniref:Ubiquitin thioesterase OTU n=1 Tax=Cordyceps fumosorosea (strain ARSEF 2679) TaxID=1081104 RepID=A0A168EFX2_CORFA|nr:Ovarian tumor, otubain [Cordyceps fumosorosea ARSEF 2679]OAA73760.1 Ovarian tumor, otubain [Cordyceps fumosorosea ARSEF 2679]